MRKLLPVILGIVGLVLGGGAGWLLRPAAPADAAADDSGCGPMAPGEDPAAVPAAPDEETEFIKLNNQFVVPVVENGAVAAMVILSLNLEIRKGEGEAVYQKEPRLRDAFLQTLFNHANSGGFRGSFTDPAAMDLLRTALRETAIAALGKSVKDVLIVDIVRQDS